MVDSPSEVLRFEAGLIWQRPNLQEVDRDPDMSAWIHLADKDDILLVGVELRVTDSSTTRSHLHISPLHSLDIAHAVFMTQLAGDDVREDLSLSVRMCGEAFARLFVSFFP
jgi:hypothetical protein